MSIFNIPEKLVTIQNQKFACCCLLFFGSKTISSCFPVMFQDCIAWIPFATKIGYLFLLKCTSLQSRRLCLTIKMTVISLKLTPNKKHLKNDEKLEYHRFHRFVFWGCPAYFAGGYFKYRLFSLLEASLVSMEIPPYISNESPISHTRGRGHPGWSRNRPRTGGISSSLWCVESFVLWISWQHLRIQILI